MRVSAVKTIKQYCIKLTHEGNEGGDMLAKNQFNKSLLAVSIITAMSFQVTAEEVEKLQVETEALKSETIEVIQVTGIRNALKEALYDKRNADSVMDSIANEDLGKFPDQNISESLQRIPGITISRNGGEGQFITVRGMGPEHNVVMLNNRILATENDGREFSFDVLATELISGIDVYKSPSASLQEGGIGSTVNLKTARPLNLDGFQAVASVKGQYDENSDEITPQLSGLVSNTFLDDRFGLLASFNYSKRQFRTERHYTDGYEARNASDFTGISDADREKLEENADENGKVHYQSYYTHDVDQSTRERIGGTLVGQWQASDDVLVTVDGLYSRLDVNSDTSGIAWWAPADAVQNLDVDENGTITDYQLSAGARPTEFVRYSRPRFAETKQVGINVDWIISDNLTAVFDASWSTATDIIAGDQSYFTGMLNNPGELTFSKRPGQLIPVYTNIGDINSKEITPSWSTLEGRNIEDTASQVTFDTVYHLAGDTAFTKILSGVSYHHRAKSRDIYKTPDSIACTYCSGGYEGFIPEDVLSGSIDDLYQWMITDGIDGIADPEEREAARQALLDNGGFGVVHRAQESGTVEENTYGAYVQANLEGYFADMSWAGNFGLRYLYTDVTSSGVSQEIISLTPDDKFGEYIPELSDPIHISEEGNYSEWLPSVNFKLNLLSDLELRLGVAKTITRPTLSNLMLTTSFNHRYSALTGYTNNSSLEPMTSWNYDSSLAWYIDDVSYLSLAYFYKELTNKWGTHTVETDIDGVTYLIDTPTNIGNGNVSGIELAFQYTFTQLPYPFDGFGVQANYTDVKETTDDSDLDNSSQSYNLVAFYENNGFEARFAYNYRDGYTESLNANRGQPRMIDDYGQLDASASYHFTDSLTVFVEAINITNEKEFIYSVHKDRLIEYTDTGARYNVGLRYKF